MKYIAKVPAQYIDEDNIRWIVIEPQLHNNEIVGYYMFLHDDINKPCKWDNWYQTLEVAFEAGEGYGIQKEKWEIFS